MTTFVGRFPRLGLAHFPTPLEPLRRLTEHLGGPTLWVKRDDCTGLGFGGNKLRKLDYVLYEALRVGADTLVTGGVAQSNSQRQVAAAAAKLGLACHLVVYRGRFDPSPPAYESTGNLALDKLFGATIHDAPWSGDRNGAIRALAVSLEAQGRRPYIVPYGVSSPLGAIGYASAAFEIADQAKALGFTPRAIVHASGSGATQAGLVLGATVCLPMTRVLGIDIDAEPERVSADVLRYGREAAELVGVAFPPEVDVVTGHAGPSYGVLDAATIEAVTTTARLEGLVLDPVYSGKGMAGLFALARSTHWSARDHIVFVHTGGAPALFAYVDQLELG